MHVEYENIYMKLKISMLGLETCTNLTTIIFLLYNRRQAPTSLGSAENLGSVGSTFYASYCILRYCYLCTFFETRLMVCFDHIITYKLALPYTFI